MKPYICGKSYMAYQIAPMLNVYVIFTARQLLAMTDSVWLSDRLTVCLSHAGIMPKRLQLRSCGLH